MRTVLALGLAAAACGPDGAAVPDAAVSVDAAIETIKVMTFNIKSGRDSSLDSIAEVINAEHPELVALQEVDNETMRTGMVDQAHRLSQLTGMASLYRSAIPYEGGTYGLAVLSEHPILSSTSMQLTSVGEQRILITVEIEIDPGRVITFADAHFGLDADTRITQANEVVAAIGSDRDVLFFGDLNDEPGTPPILRLDAAFRDAWKASGEGDGFTIPVDTPTRRIDYMFLGAGWSVPLDIHVVDTRASDHRPVVATLPRN